MTRRRSLKALQNEQKLRAALTNVSKGKFKTGYAASKAHRTSAATLYRRLKGGLTRAQARIITMMNNDNEEGVILMIIFS